MFDDIVWKEGEELTQKYMTKQGYKILWTNYSTHGVELDIIALLSKKVQKSNLKKAYKSKIHTLNKSNKDEFKQTKKILKHKFKQKMLILDDLLVITEVKARSSNKYGIGAEAVDDYKMANIKKATMFLIKEKALESLQVRFDVSSVDGLNITYIEDVF